MADTVQNALQIWQRTGLVQRVLLAGVGVACVGATALLVGWARQPQMAMLYSQMDPEEASRVVEKICDEGIAYELADGGTTIRVPRDSVYSLRLTMASQGLPSGGQRGYKILDEGKIGTSPFKERINFIRAIEGELAKTIQMIDGISVARVHIVRPESSVFASHSENASATVTIRTQAGWRLSPGNVASIIHLVAGSVEGIIPENVTLVDSRGQLLSGSKNNELASGSGTFLDYKARVEDYLSGKVEGLLSSALGPNRARVRVDAVIDTSRVNETTETYDNENKVVSKEEMKSRASTPLAAPAGSDGKGGGVSGNKTQEEDMVNEYLVSRVVQQKSDLPGKITSITVAAFVDLTPPPVKEGETAAPATLTIKDVEEIIRNAIGLKETDTLKVAQTPFHQPEAATLPLDEPGGRLSDPEFWLDIARQCSLGVLVIGALIALRIFHPKKMASPESGDRLALDGLLSNGKSLPQSVADADPQQLRAQITNALQSNPEEVKRLFLRWVESEKGGA